MAAVESFAEFCVRELAARATEGVISALKDACKSFINGSSETEELMKKVFDELQASDVGSYSPCESVEFQKDLEECFSESLMYEYLSKNWDNMDGLINANSSSPSVEDVVPEEEQQQQKSEKWNNLKTKFVRKKIQEDLKSNRQFSIMAEVMKGVKSATITEEVLKAEEVLNKNRVPTIVLLGGGMGAGKSTVVNLLVKRKEGVFSSKPVVIEADALKMMDPVFQALNKVENGANAVSQLVHGYSTDAANGQLLLALKEQRNIVMDGTMTWMPYVQQTINMIRDAHKNIYRLGPGYQIDEDGNATEQYWEVVEAATPKCDATGTDRRPYKVEMVGVTVDPEKAVARGLRRKLITGRGVPANGQLRSHRLYSENFEPYLDLIDKVVLFDTSGPGDPQMVATKETGQPLLRDPDPYMRFLRKKKIVDSATGVGDMYADDGPPVTFSQDGISEKLKESLSPAVSAS